jgi:hypothetical protein
VVVTVWESGPLKVMLLTGAIEPSLRSHVYVTVLAPVIVICPEKSKVVGHV